MYDDYHSKGLEIVGVSNDYDADALKSFVLNAQMPWPEFFDADAAAKNEFNSITKGQKIDGIPVMYLIDKKGVLRTVNARENMEELIPKLLAEAD
jgi:peroxiredoxin